VRTFDLPRSAFDMLLEARVFDLYDDGMPTLDDLEGYAGETASSLLQLTAIVLNRGEDAGAAEASGHAGVAEVVVGVLAGLGNDATRFVKYVPDTLLAKHGL